MTKTKWILAAAITAAAVLSVALRRAEALVAAPNIDWSKNVFIQEFYRGETPCFAIGNLTKKDATVSVTDRAGNLLAGPVLVKAGASLALDASTLANKGILTFKNGDVRLGTLPSPPAAEKGAKGLTSRFGLNGSGGRQNDVWIEQPAEAVKADTDFEVTLVVPKNAGTIRFSKKGEMNNAISQLPILDAKSETLPIEAKGDTLVIDANKATKDAASHTVTLRFHAPAVGVAPMAMISGWRMMPSGGGHGITRGILIAPK